MFQRWPMHKKVLLVVIFAKIIVPYHRTVLLKTVLIHQSCLEQFWFQRTAVIIFPIKIEARKMYHQRSTKKKYQKSVCRQLMSEILKYFTKSVRIYMIIIASFHELGPTMLMHSSTNAFYLWMFRHFRSLICRRTLFSTMACNSFDRHKFLTTIAFAVAWPDPQSPCVSHLLAISKLLLDGP